MAGTLARARVVGGRWRAILASIRYWKVQLERGDRTCAFEIKLIDSESPT